MLFPHGQVTAQKSKCFIDVEYLKDAFLKCAEKRFHNFTNKKDIITRIEEMPLSSMKVQRQTDEMAADIREQMTQGLQTCNTISLALDESININDIPCLAIIVHYFILGEVWGELFSLRAIHSTMKATTYLVLSKTFSHNRSTCYH